MTTRGSNAYIALIVASGAASLLYGALHWHSENFPRYLSYCIVALIASGMKVSLPSVPGTMSMHFVFVVVGITQLGFGETVAMGCAGMLVQSLFRTRNRPQPIQVIFSVSSVACSIWFGYFVYHSRLLEGRSFEMPARILLASAAYFIVNTLSVSMVIALTEKKRVWRVWRESYFWSFPNYLVGAQVAWLVSITSSYFGWQSSLLMMPVIYVIYRSHTLYVTRIEEAKKRAQEQQAHAEEVAALHRRTIETLALAIEAKDQTTADHLERVEVYAVEVGRELSLTSGEMEALRAAALLHDIGKIAVPEYIISKPGRLTPEEFERMKTHTIVGAEIAEQIQFPYPVAPIIRSHHEKWNGTGYPDGLAGDRIPIGARILSAVDCLDALASDRQYRRALPLDEAIQIVRKEAGVSFDPRVVEVLVRRYVELERKAKSHKLGGRGFSTGLKITRGDAPAAGFEGSATGDLINFHNSIAALEELTSKLEAAAAVPQAVAILTAVLRNLLPYASMAVYTRRGNRLIPEGLDGAESSLFSSLEIPLGMGLSGWVAENGKPILNGNPSVEPGYLSDPTKFSNLRSALAVPLESGGEILGVLALYRQERDAFHAAHLETLIEIGGRFAKTLRRITREESRVAG